MEQLTALPMSIYIYDPSLIYGAGWGPGRKRAGRDGKWKASGSRKGGLGRGLSYTFCFLNLAALKQVYDW